MEQIMKKMCRGGYMEGMWRCRLALEGDKPQILMTPNAEMLSRASGNRELNRLLLGGDILFPDGVGAFLGMKRLGLSPKERSEGIELGRRMLENIAARKGNEGVFLLGGRPKVAKMAAKRLSSAYPGLKICGAEQGYFDNRGEENSRIIKKINDSGARLLIVCMGFPRQERWMLENRDRLTDVRLMMGLGGSLDVWSGRVGRAPESVRRLGLEWAYRALKEPSRLKRLPHLASYATDVLRLRKK